MTTTPTFTIHVVTVTMSYSGIPARPYMASIFADMTDTTGDVFCGTFSECIDQIFDTHRGVEFVESATPSGDMVFTPTGRRSHVVEDPVCSIFGDVVFD